jgi:hypothetical protein
MFHFYEQEFAASVAVFRKAVTCDTEHWQKIHRRPTIYLPSPDRTTTYLNGLLPQHPVAFYQFHGISIPPESASSSSGPLFCRVFSAIGDTSKSEGRRPNARVAASASSPRFAVGDDAAGRPASVLKFGVGSAWEKKSRVCDLDGRRWGRGISVLARKSLGVEVGEEEKPRTNSWI